MAGTGPKPRGELIRIPRDAKAKQPPALPGAEGYSEAVHAWYETWTASPQASIFTATEWQALHLTAPLVQTYLDKPTAALRAEIRINEAKLGATREDRLRLRWLIEGEGEIDDPEPVDDWSRSARRRPDPRKEPLR